MSKNPEGLHSEERRNFPWGKTALLTTELVPTATLAVGIITNNLVMSGISAIVLAAAGIGTYLYNMSEFMRSPSPKA